MAIQIQNKICQYILIKLVSLVSFLPGCAHHKHVPLTLCGVGITKEHVFHAEFVMIVLMIALNLLFTVFNAVKEIYCKFSTSLISFPSSFLHLQLKESQTTLRYIINKLVPATSSAQDYSTFL